MVLGDTLEIVVRLAGKVVREFPPEEIGELVAMYEARAKSIQLEASDPYHHGYEPEFWGELDWFVARLRAEHPGEVVEICIQGGNRAGKTDYCAKRMCEVIDLNENGLIWCFHTDQKSSRAVQQERMWTYMPLHHKPAEGKAKKGLKQRMNYNAQSGFTENGFALSNGTRCEYKFYSGNAQSLEGDQPSTCWSDEEIPLDWMKAIAVRLLTRAGQTRALCDQLGAAIAKHEAGELATLPKVLRARMWQGVHLISFTPISGLTAAVARFTKGAATVRAEPAPQLPIIGRGGRLKGYEMMPRLTRQPGEARGAAYIWNSDNKHGGNHEGMVAMAAKDKWSLETKQIKLYGYTEKTVSATYPKFSPDIHVRPAHELPGEGTWYHVVDPCNGRNWFMGWFLVDPRGNAWAAYEWPPAADYVPGVGVPGMWVIDSEGKRLDGDKGPAQDPFGWGTQRYAEEIARVEAEIFAMQHGTEFEELRRIDVFLRIMDSRYGASPNATSGGTVTIMELMEELGLEFEPSGQSIVAEGEVKSRVNEGRQMVANMLDYNEELAKPDANGVLVPDPSQAPRLYVLEHCHNFRWVFENYTGLDGQSGAGKDPDDVLRYFAICEPGYYPPMSMGGSGGGSY